jgi:autophagy-related protein 17
MPSPSSSIHADDQLTASPTLDTLIPHLLAARRSLSCVEHVSRANYLVSSTRQSLEDHTIITARTLFVRNGSKAQTATLDRVRAYTTSIAREAGDEFQEVIEKLDAAETRLRTTLAQLKSTPVDSKLRPEGEEPKHLVDFVDETGVQKLTSSIRESIDTTIQARKSFDESITALGEETERVKELLSSRRMDSITDLGQDTRSPVPEILSYMEQHAEDMAKNLESLVKHFDLCVTAIKHTEGGGAAASKIAQDLPGGMDLDIGKDEGPLERISDEEMSEILGVLAKDAAEVDDVVAEIKDSIAEMEASAERVTAFGDYLAAEFARTSAAFHLLEEVGQKLPGYITQSQIFTYRWDEERGKISEYMDDLENLRAFYSNFISAYDSLLIEVGRRKDVERRISKIRQEAILRIDRLVQEEIEERQSFRQEQGDFLPVDIWPGLVMAPARYELNRIEGSMDSIPDISASVINKAIKRVSQQRSNK